MLVHLHVNKTNFHVKGFALGLALKQRRKATGKSPIQDCIVYLYLQEDQLGLSLLTVEQVQSEEFQKRILHHSVQA